MWRVIHAAGVNSPDTALEEARRAGIDLDLLDTNLMLSVAERWRQHDVAFNFILKLEEARRAQDAGPRHSPEAAR